MGTIVAVATPPGRAARAVVRVSGPAALRIVTDCFRLAAGEAGLPGARRGVRRGWFDLGERLPLAPATAWIQAGQRTYTGEDLVELHLPGAPALLELVIARLLALGARLAEPGEFTRRAFLSGRIDLSRAEAVAALIRATDRTERQRALALLEGGLERRVAFLRERILAVLVPLEAAFDFADQDLDVPIPDAALSELELALEELARLSEPGQAPARSDSFRVLLEGPANAGKSSLFNRLVGREAALVSRIPGTTRDVITADIELSGMHVRLLDTAGEDVDRGPADREAHRHRRRALREADLVVEVRDARGPPEQAPAGGGRVRVRTHADLVPPAPALAGAVFVSNVTGAGLADVRKLILDALHAPSRAPAQAPVLINERHAEAFRDVHDRVSSACRTSSAGGPPECVASDLHLALAGLRRITGEGVEGEVLDRVFATFCIGK